MIVCLVLPGFVAVIEHQVDPALAATSLILIEGERVLTASHETVQADVASGLPLYQAKLLCPQARLILAKPTQHCHDRLKATPEKSQPTQLRPWFAGYAVWLLLKEPQLLSPDKKAMIDC